MKREELAHILRAAAAVAADGRILVLGSQSILGSFNETQLPETATVSVEADIAFFDDSNEKKADKVEGAIGEGSGSHGTFGYYGQGVGISVAVLPFGWKARVVPFATGDIRRCGCCLPGTP